MNEDRTILLIPVDPASPAAMEGHLLQSCEVSGDPRRVIPRGLLGAGLKPVPEEVADRVQDYVFYRVRDRDPGPASSSEPSASTLVSGYSQRSRGMSLGTCLL